MSSALAKPTPHPLLVKYLSQLSKHPLRTKAITTATFCFLQEVLGSHIARVPPPKISPDAPIVAAALSRAHINIRAIKMALYGLCISAPLSHFLVGLLQKAFAGKTSTKAKIGQIVASNLLVSPIQVSAFLASMAIINGAKSANEIIKTMKAGFFSVIRVSWTVSPLSFVIAQKYVPVELWVPFFNAIQFVLGTYFNARVKQMRLAAQEKAEREKRNAEKKRDASS